MYFCVLCCIGVILYFFRYFVVVCCDIKIVCFDVGFVVYVQNDVVGLCYVVCELVLLVFIEEGIIDE